MFFFTDPRDRLRALAALVGMLLAWGLIHGGLQRQVFVSREYVALQRADARTARWVGWWMTWSVLSGTPLLCVGLLNALEAHGVVRAGGRRPGTPGPFPFDPSRTAVVIGEVHQQEGARSAEPGWLVLPEGGLQTGVLVVGATGRGKTSAVLYPLLRQLIQIQAGSADHRLGGLIVDPKGNMVEDVRRMATAAGRAGDVYAVTVPEVRCNLIKRPDLMASALAGHLMDLYVNLTGPGGSDFWMMAAKELAAQSIRLLRLTSEEQPTLTNVYRAAASPEGFMLALAQARARRASMGPAELGELEALEYWYENSLRPMAPATRTGVAANLNTLCSLFDEGLMRDCFCARSEEETFPGFERLLEEGKIIVLSIPKAVYKSVAGVVGTMMKLNFQDAVLARLARAERANAEVGRTCFFWCDEYDEIVTSPGDGVFFSKCREARCINLVALQSYAGLRMRLRERGAVEHVLANLTTKIWLGLEDEATAVSAAELCGKVEREKASRSVAENSQQASFSVVDRRSIREGQVSASSSTHWQKREEFLFPPWSFTGLARFRAIVKAFDGANALPPWLVYVRPEEWRGTPVDQDCSWFDLPRDIVGEARQDGLAPGEVSG